jgi:hypothetical protein
VAIRNAGPCYKQGTGLPNNAMGPARWYKAAAEAGEPMASRSSGGALRLGYGARRQFVDTRMYLRKGLTNIMAMSRSVRCTGVKRESGWGLKRCTSNSGLPPKRRCRQRRSISNDVRGREGGWDDQRDAFPRTHKRCSSAGLTPHTGSGIPT